MKYLAFLLIMFLATLSYGQKIRINVKPDSVTFSSNGAFEYPPYKIKAIDDPTFVYIIWKKGYVNHGFTYAELEKKGISTYAVQLERVKPLSLDYTSKIINVYKVVDKTGRVKQVSVNDHFYLSVLSEKFITYGYKNVTNADLFDTQKEKEQLKIVGEITEFSKNTMGGYFQVSIMVNWSVYDVSEGKVVFQLPAAGYSNTESKFEKELSLALKNALVGLMSNAEFQRIAEASK